MAEEFKRKRKRIHLSCLQCAKSKRKCCKKLPCDNCVVRGIVCEYEEGANPKIVTLSTGNSPHSVPRGICSTSPSEESVASSHSGNSNSSAVTDATESQLYAQPVVYTKESIDGIPSAKPVLTPGSETPLSNGSASGKPASAELYNTEQDTEWTPNQMSCDNEWDGPPNFVLRQGIGYQRMTSRYYGPSSGPSLLFFNTPYILPYQNRERFPKETIPGFDEILEAYKQRLHWVISCFDWDDLTKWLESDNISATNRLIYLVLALGSIVSGRLEDGAEFEARSRRDNADDLLPNKCGAPCNSDLLIVLLRAFYFDLKGQQETVWLLLSQGISRAVSMGYHREWVREEKILKGSRLLEHRVRRARVWNTLLEFQYKYSLMLGRPYSVPPRMSDSPRVLVSTNNFSVEKSFRDFLNLLAPLYREFVDELLMPDSKDSKNKDFNKLLLLDTKISAWWNDVINCYMPRTKDYLSIPQLPVSESTKPAKSLEDKIIKGQYLSLELYKLFLRSRIHREFMRSPSLQQSAYSSEQFFITNRAFSINAATITEINITHGLTDITAFTIDNFLYYTMCVYICAEVNNLPYKNYAIETQQVLESILTDIANRPGPLSHIAQNALKASVALKMGMPNGTLLHPLEEASEPGVDSNTPTDDDEHATSSSNGTMNMAAHTNGKKSSPLRAVPMEPLKVQNITSIPVNNVVQQQSRSVTATLSSNDVGASFDISDWTGILSDFKLDPLSGDDNFNM